MTTGPDDLIWERFRECAAMIERQTLDVVEHGVETPHSIAILEAYRCGDHIIRLRARNGQPTPFDRFDAFPPGALDVRVFDQATWWVDEQGTHHRIDELGTEANTPLLRTILRLLDEASVHHEAYTRAFPARTVPADPRVWLVGTALLTALLQKVQEGEVCASDHP